MRKTLAIASVATAGVATSCGIRHLPEAGYPFAQIAENVSGKLIWVGVSASG